MDKLRLASLLGQYQASMQYFGADGLGSVRQIIDASAAVVGSSRYDPFAIRELHSCQMRVTSLNVEPC